MKILSMIATILDLKSIKEDLRKVGITFMTGGIAGIFLQHLVSIKLALWLAMIGVILWCCGIIKKHKGGELL